MGRSAPTRSRCLRREIRARLKGSSSFAFLPIGSRLLREQRINHHRTLRTLRMGSARTRANLPLRSRYSITSSARASSGSGTFRYDPNVLTGPTRFSHRHDPLHQPRLLVPEAHVHLAIHRRRGGQTLPSLLWLAGAAIELA